MFDTLTDRLQAVFKKLKGRGKLNDADVEAALKEVRIALLEADVNYNVVKSFVASIKERAIGQEVMKSLTPGQQVVKIVHEELTKLMGESRARIASSPAPPTIVMLVGLQGSGKTTSCGKLARMFKLEGRRPLLVAADIYRPAAVEQLKQVGRQVEVDVFSLGFGADPVKICVDGVNLARERAFDPVILDTAGRLHIDERLMQELRSIKRRVVPTEVLLVADAMTGQDAVNVAEHFGNDLGVDGVILTKLDGDARGGAAISIRAVTGKPIKLVGMGEKLDPLEPFHPGRMASRILGMGDVLTFIERAERAMGREQQIELQRKLKEQEYDLDDFLSQIRQLRSMGPLDQVFKMIPGIKKLMGGAAPTDADESDVQRLEAIILSMTPVERASPGIISGSRRRRIAGGSGTTPADVNTLLRDFQQTRKMIKQFQILGKGGKGRRPPGGLRLPFPRPR